MGTIFFLYHGAESATSNGQGALECRSAEAFGKRAKAFHDKPVYGVVCTRNTHTFDLWRAFLKSQGTRMTMVHINEAPEVIGRGLEEAFGDAKKLAGDDEPALRRTLHIRQQIAQLIDTAAGGMEQAMLVVAPRDLLQPILLLLHNRWRGDQAPPPPLDPCGLAVVSVDRAKPGEARKKNGDYVVANFTVVPSDNGTAPDPAPAASVVAAPAV